MLKEKISECEVTYFFIIVRIQRSLHQRNRPEAHTLRIWAINKSKL